MWRPGLKFRRDRPIVPGETVHEESAMGLDVAPIGVPSFSTTPERAPRASRADAARDASTVSAEIPDGPPPEVLEAMDAAGRVARELHASGRELRFTPPEEPVGRVLVEVGDLDGNVLRTIPPSEALDVATGSPLD
jgi:uncharacterized FlaG/YvyC family protein